MGDKNKTVQKQDNSIDPWSKRQFEGTKGKIDKLMSQPFVGYDGDRVAGLDPMEDQAASGFMATMGEGSDALRGGMGYLSNRMAYNPVDIRGLLAADADLSGYMNPYEDAVVGRAMGDIDEMRQRQINDSQSAAVRAGAFGGSRHGVVDSLTNEAALDAMGDTSASLRSAGYDRAMAAFNNDADRRMNVDMYNDQAGRANVGLLGDFAGNLSDMNAREAFALQAFGQNARNVEQSELDAAYQEFLREQEDPFRRSQMQLGLLGVTPTITDSTTTGTQKTQPGALSILGTTAQAGANIASMFSDARLKTDIVPDGEMSGFNAYRFRYVWDEPGTERRGVMAHEVQERKPEAVSRSESGFLKVDYGAL